MDEEKKTVRLREIKAYMDILANHRLVNSLPDETIIELHQALGTVVSLIEHMEEGED